MASRSDEYTSLRQEIIDHQDRRESILALVATVTVALVAAGVEFDKPFLSLAAILLLFAARVQITHIHYGIQRIAAYIRVMHEEENPELKWETASYLIRSYSRGRQPALQAKRSTNAIDPELNKRIRNVSSILPMETLLLLMGVLAGLLAVYLYWSLGQPAWSLVSLVVLGMWGAAWFWYQRRWQSLFNMDVEDDEAEVFRQLFKGPKRKGPESTVVPPATTGQV